MRKNLRTMAMGMGLLLLLSSLLACQPTPEAEVVVNKGDRVLEEKISAVTPTQNPTENGEKMTAAPVRQYTFPDRWDEVYDAGNELVLTFNADIVQKEDGTYPVYRSKAGSVDKETMEKVLNTLLPAPVSVHETVMTKDDWKEEMEWYLKEMEEQQERLRLSPEDRGDGDNTEITQEEIEKKLKWYAEQIAAAPDSLEEVAVTDFSNLKSNTRLVYPLSDGDTAVIRFGYNFWAVCRSVSEWGIVIASYDTANLTEQEITKEPTITQEEALKQGRETLDKLGFTDFVLMEVYEANYSETANWKYPMSGGYTMRYKRDFGGYPLVTCVEPSQRFNYGEGDGYVVNRYIEEEYVDVYVDETGVRYMEYNGPKEIIKEENAAVELLDFETVQEKIRKALTYGLTGNTKVAEIYKMVLTVNTQWVAGSSEYYEVPCWIVYYDDHDYSGLKKEMTEEELQALKERKRAPHFVMEQALYINAIDGSVIDPQAGY